jgi:hypothetical protein
MQELVVISLQSLRPDPQRFAQRCGQVFCSLPSVALAKEEPFVIWDLSSVMCVALFAQRRDWVGSGCAQRR